MASLRAPAPTPVPTSTLASRRSFHMPLSSHGMPKAPRALSPERPHRFSTIVLPNSPAVSSPMTPISPGPMSPPMSAKSFGTFIDSAPSTPAYSPRHMYEEWGHSHKTILRPMSSSSAPSSPTEPSWEMMAPVKQFVNVTCKHEDCAVAKPKSPTAAAQSIVLSKPAKKAKPATPVRATTIVPKSIKSISEEDALRRESEAQARKLVEKEESALRAQEATPPEPSPKSDVAPLGKLATRMKSLLRRNTSEKKKKKKPHQEFHRIEDAHWSEM